MITTVFDYCFCIYKQALPNGDIEFLELVKPLSDDIDKAFLSMSERYSSENIAWHRNSEEQYTGYSMNGNTMFYFMKERNKTIMNTGERDPQFTLIVNGVLCKNCEFWKSGECNNNDIHLKHCGENDHCSRGVLRQKRCNWELFIEEKEDYEQLKICGFTNRTLEEVKKRVESLFSNPIRWYGYGITGASGDIEEYDRVFMLKIVEKRR